MRSLSLMTRPAHDEPPRRRATGGRKVENTGDGEGADADGEALAKLGKVEGQQDIPGHNPGTSSRRQKALDLGHLLCTRPSRARRARSELAPCCRKRTSLSTTSESSGTASAGRGPARGTHLRCHGDEVTHIPMARVTSIGALCQ